MVSPASCPSRAPAPAPLPSLDEEGGTFQRPSRGARHRRDSRRPELATSSPLGLRRRDESCRARTRKLGDWGWRSSRPRGYYVLVVSAEGPGCSCGTWRSSRREGRETRFRSTHNRRRRGRLDLRRDRRVRGTRGPSSAARKARAFKERAAHLDLPDILGTIYDPAGSDDTPS